MTSSCSHCHTSFSVTDADREFLKKLSPVIAKETHELPPPTHCPECRQQRRYACRNDRNYYSGNCHICKKSLITSYSSDKNIPVLCDECFWGDGWDPLQHAMEFDFQKPFFEQFRTLREQIPRVAIYHTQSENCDYTVHSSKNHNCYIGSSIVWSEDVHYSDLVNESRNCMDLYSCLRVELCYECSFCMDCFGCSHCENCTNLSDSILCFDCRASSDLFGCIGQRNKHNRILNQDASKDECQKVRERWNTDPGFRKEFTAKHQELKRGYPHRDTWLINCEECTGNYIWNSKGAVMSFNVREAEDVRYFYEGFAPQNLMDCSRIGRGEFLYDCGSIVELVSSAFCNLTYQCSNLLYCDNCNGTKNCFGCFGLKKHEWCILNKQYAQRDYEALVPKIIEHMRLTKEWGEFFPITISPFGYNETKSHEWYPMNRSEVEKRGWRWSDYEAPMVAAEKTIPGSKLPPDIKNVPDDILHWAIVCEVSGKPFKIIKQELEFYRDRGIPVPHRSPKQRHFDRIAPHNIRTLYDRSCGKCGKAIQTIYSVDRPEIVYCEECYLKEVY